MSKHPEKRIILASASPRRKYLLRVLLNNFGLKFVVIPANIAEYIPKNASNYAKIAQDLAIEKAKAVALNNNGIIISADTIVAVDGKVLGKPANTEEAKKMLRNLSGREHKVFTGIAILDSGKNRLFNSYETTRVRFRKISKKEIDFYVAGGSPMDKAGAYGIQDDLGSTFAEKITGDYFNVVGLPMVKTYLGLKKMKVLVI